MRLLHAGCGTEPLPEWFPATVEEVRLDANPAANPHIVGSIVDLPDGIGTFDIVYCCHVLEHVYPHEVARVLAGFERVLAPDGKCIVVVPDLQDVPPTDDVLYVSPGGPICGLDIIYGARCVIEDNLYMAHHCGFIESTLRVAMETSFPIVKTARYAYYNLMGVGLKQ